MRPTSAIRAWLAGAIVLPAIANGLAGAQATEPNPSFCGLAAGKTGELATRVAAVAGIKEVFRNAEYVAYQDPASQTVFTFTAAGQAAHPAAVCRRPLQKGEALELEMVIVCEGPERRCADLEGDFKLLNAKMQADINNQIGAKR